MVDGEQRGNLRKIVDGVTGQSFLVQAMGVLVLLLIAPPSFADIIHLKNGDHIKGRVTAQTEDFVKVDVGVGVDIAYFRDEIVNIEDRDDQVQSFDEINWNEFTPVSVDSELFVVYQQLLDAVRREDLSEIFQHITQAFRADIEALSPYNRRLLIFAPWVESKFTNHKVLEQWNHLDGFQSIVRMRAKMNVFNVSLHDLPYKTVLVEGYVLFQKESGTWRVTDLEEWKVTRDFVLSDQNQKTGAPTSDPLAEMKEKDFKEVAVDPKIADVYNRMVLAVKVQSLRDVIKCMPANSKIELLSKDMLGRKRFLAFNLGFKSFDGFHVAKQTMSSDGRIAVLWMRVELDAANLKLFRMENAQIQKFGKVYLVKESDGWKVAMENWGLNSDFSVPR